MKKKMKKKTKSKKQKMKTFACFARDLKNTTQEKKKKKFTMSGKINIEFKWKRVKSLRFIYSKYLLAFPRVPLPRFHMLAWPRKLLIDLSAKCPQETHTK